MTNEEAIAILIREIDEDPFMRTEYREQIHKALNKAIEALKQLTIIRCKDCKFAHLTYDGDVKYCDIWSPDESIYINGDNFCSLAERKVSNKE